MSPGSASDVGKSAELTGGVHIVQWVERTLGGTVTAIDRLARWRPSWRLEVAREGQLLHLYARGDRGPDFPSPFSLDHELIVHELLEAHAIPVPHVYGIVDDGPVRALIMDLVPGQQGLALAANDEERSSLLEGCIDYMVLMHRIDVADVARRGIAFPSDSAAIAMSAVFTNVEQIYLDRDHPLDPIVEYLRRWLRRNLPQGRDKSAFVAYDSAQFLHHDGELTALIDFELAHVGDPYMDLAPLRCRDTIEPLGNLMAAFDRYAQLTGEPIDFDLLRYYEISQLAVSIMLAYCTLTDPDPETDLVSHMTFYSDSAGYALDILSELYGIAPQTVEVPEPRVSAHAKAHQHLVTSLRRVAGREPLTNLVRFGIDVKGAMAAPLAATGSPDAYLEWRNRCAYRLARHLRRVDEIGAELESQDLFDVAAVVPNSGFSDMERANTALLALIEAAGPESDVDLIRLFARRIQRVHMMLGPADSLVVRHPPLQPMPGGGGAHPGARCGASERESAS